jgi:hypothetical protein
MRISYREAGGVAGLARGVEIDTARLPPAEARRVEALVAQAGLTTEARRGPQDARDLLGYEIVIETEAGRTVAAFDDATLPAEAEPLLEYLQQRARPLPRR